MSSSPYERTPSRGGDDNNNADDDAADEGVQRRSERKREREKKRRSDLTSAFDELSQLIVQLDPMDDDSSIPGDKKRRRKSSMDGTSGEDAGGITRLDVIGRALRIIKRLHRENEERKRIISSYESRGGPPGGNPNDNVLVMVPSLTPILDEHPVARASYPSSYPQSYMSHPSGTPPYYHASSHDPGNAISAYAPPPPHHHSSAAAAYHHGMGYGLSSHHHHHPPPPPPHHHSHPLEPPLPQRHHSSSSRPQSRSGDLSPIQHPQSPSGGPQR
jgi:Helix-loop-helix DNA-binding domain